MADYTASRLARASVLAWSFLGACATELQETNEPVETGEGDAGSGGMAGSGGTNDSSAAGKNASGAGGAVASSAGSTNVAGSSAGTGGAGSGGGGAASAGSGAEEGGAAGAGGKGGAAGAGGKGGAGGAGGKAGAGGMAGTGGSNPQPNPCATAKLVIKGGAASSIEDATFPAAQAWDGDAVTRWASLKTEPHWIYVDLGEVAHVSRVRLFWEAAYATVYDIERANAAGGPWTSMQHVTGANGGTDDLTTLTAGNGRYIRMNGITRFTAYGFSLYEIEVYGDLDETCD